MKRDRPINADEPAAPPPTPLRPPKEEPAKAQPAPEQGSPKASPGPKPAPITPKPEPAEPKPEAAKPAAELKPEPAESPSPAGKPSPAVASKPPRKPPRGRRRPIPLTPKLLAALVLVAIAFIVAAILGSSGGGPKSASDSPGPAPAPIADAGKAPDDSAAQTAEQLGYPAFATNNTTRIGGSDAAANAAAVALAVFPSTTPDQRPAAVTYVGEDDWAGAIAAAVLMAAPVRAPLLISNPDGMPAASSEALAVLSPQGSAATGSASAFAIGDVSYDASTDTPAVAAGPAAAEAAEIAELRDRLFGSPPAHIVIAPSARPDIAMPAAAWAARSGDPVLFAGADDLPAVTETALKRHTSVPIYVLGPTTAISDGVLKQVAKIDKDVKRVSGADAVANAIAFARYSDGDFGWNINDPGHGFVLARGDAPIDAALAAPLSASGTWGPLLLTDSATKLPPELRSYFLDVKPGYTTNPTRAFYNHVWVVGDQEAIDVNQQAEVNGLAELAKIEGGEP